MLPRNNFVKASRNLSPVKKPVTQPMMGQSFQNLQINFGMLEKQTHVAPFFLSIFVNVVFYAS